MTRRVAITGLGLITPLGHSAWSNWKALLSGKTVADRLIPHPDFPGFVDEMDLVQKIGAVSLTRHPHQDPALLLMERAAREAIDMAGLSRTVNHESRLPTWIGLSKGAMHHYQNCLSKSSDWEVETAIHDFFPVDHMSVSLCQRLPLSIHRQYIAACASSMIAFIEASHAVESGRVDQALVLTAEAALLPLFVHSYQRMGALAPVTPREYQARPLSQKRQGFTLCEAGAAVLIQAEDLLIDQPVFAWFEKGSLRCDAHHIVNSTPERLAMQKVSTDILPGDKPVDLLHPHATGTVENDEAELQTLHHTLQDTQSLLPDLYACKGALGHAMGASGLMAIVLSALAARTQRRPAMPWLDDPIKMEMIQRASPSQKEDRTVRTLSIERQALFSAGFGGHVAGLSLLSN